MKYFLLLITLISSVVNAKTLDKIVAIFNEEIITLSQINRIRATLPPRVNLAPQVYKNDKISEREIITNIVNSKLIRDKLNAMGYIITDDQVEAQIKQTEQRHGLNREALVQFLKTNHLTFDEYFELTREAIEYNIFGSRVLEPLVSVTEQEIKNEFYRQHSNDMALSFKYFLINFSSRNSSDLGDKLQEIVSGQEVDSQQSFAVGPINVNTLGNISEDGLVPELKKALKNTEEGAFSKPIFMDGLYHVFFVKKKDLVDSERYLKVKDSIREKLFTKQLDQVSSLWFSRESNKHFVKIF